MDQLASVCRDALDQLAFDCREAFLGHAETGSGGGYTRLIQRRYDALCSLEI
jgi:hypothetical protein